MSLQKTPSTTTLILPPASSIHPTLGIVYRPAGHRIEYFTTMTRTGKNYYDSEVGISDDSRMSTAAEELAIQLDLEKTHQDPRKAAAFDDLFGRNDSHWYAWQWTKTGLRVPNGQDPTEYETDRQGRKYWVREVLAGNEVVGKIPVPEGNGRVVVEWDEVFGIPRATKEIGWPHRRYTTHFRFNPNPKKDDTSGHYDVAVGRRSGWPHDVMDRCLVVSADFERSLANSDDGFRTIRGSLPKIEPHV
ncbi:MAG: hypothetical protein HY515_02155 [Candidatus Aenigmarchaeota archaeon]|nr:hypothetical protein [Candidatus Aenigmarchaeota archaeon]